MAKNTNIPLNNTTQTLSLYNINRGMNTNMVNNSFTQTEQPGSNTSNNRTSEDCKCGVQEMSQPLTHFQSNFSRQLDQRQAIGNRHGIENMQTYVLDYSRYPRN